VSAASTATPSARVSLRTIPGRSVTNVTDASGSRDSTSYGPMASRAVNRSNSGMAMRMTGLLVVPVMAEWWCGGWDQADSSVAAKWRR
jgi:hypothetical protein